MTLIAKKDKITKIYHLVSYIIQKFLERISISHYFQTFVSRKTGTKNDFQNQFSDYGATKVNLYSTQTHIFTRLRVQTDMCS